MIEKRRYSVAFVPRVTQVYDKEKDKQLTSFELDDLLLKFEKENNEKDKNCYNCKNREGYDEGEGYGFVFLCKKDCMNTDGYFDYEYHRFKKPCVCPFWELEE